MILKFINRNNELEALETAYLSGKAEFFVIYGRRRIGKTELIKMFSMDKLHFYFLARQQDMVLEKERFRQKFSEKFNVYLSENNTLEELFKEILNKVDLKNKLIIIIDEFPYWIERDKGIPSEFQHLWEQVLNDKNIFLILSGSYVSMMEEKVLGVKSPLYGRRTGQIKIDPMDIGYLSEFFPKYDTKSLIKIYGAVGMIPFYLNEMKERYSFEENIKNTFFNKANILNQEARILLKEELREENTYFNILRAIVEGSTRPTEIANKSKVDITNINKYLDTLINLKLVKRERPVTFPIKEKGYSYFLYDNYFRFWLSYLYPYEGEFEEDPDSLLNFLKRDYDNYLGYIFEDFCIKLLRKISYFKDYKEKGRWWHKDKEIDIIALNYETAEILFCECKWKEKVDAGKILKELIKKTESVKWNDEKRKESFAVFAKSFKKKIKEFEGKKVYCFDLKDIGKILKRG